MNQLFREHSWKNLQCKQGTVTRSYMFLHKILDFQFLNWQIINSFGEQIGFFNILVTLHYLRFKHEVHFFEINIPL